MSARLLTVATVLAASIAVGIAAPRTWTDTQGRTMEADAVEKSTGAILVRRTDGQVFTIELSKLSPPDRQWVADWQPTDAPPARIEDAILMVTTPRAKGSAFLVHMDGAVYAVTNQHVIFGATEGGVELVSVSGRRYKTTHVDVSSARDLARFKVVADAALSLAFLATLDEPVVAYGNSLGADVATIGRGRVVGLSEDELEVSTEIVEGNSGGPIVNARGAVIGVSTYLTREPLRWTTEDTRYAKPRRFALRIQPQEEWTRITWSLYSEQTSRMLAARAFVEMIEDIAYEMRQPQIITTPDSAPEPLRELILNHNSNVREIGSHRNQFVARHRGHLHSLRTLLLERTRDLALSPSRIENAFLLKSAAEIASRSVSVNAYIEERETRLRY